MKSENELIFDYEIGDTVILSSGLLAFIAYYGIYDNQYWCEICYPDGIHLGAADYFSTDQKPWDYIIGKANNDERDRIKNEVIKTLNNYANKPLYSERISVFYNYLKITDNDPNP